jgi:iron complex outermembrane receptor protein
MPHSSTHPFRLSLLAAALSLATGTWAQSALAEEPTAAEAKKAERPQALEAVVITAERRKESAQRTSISLTAISGDEARDKGQTSLANIVTDTPSLNIQASPQGGQIYIRGIGSSGDSNWIDPAVGLMLDGVYSGRAETVMSSMYDIARVEVLRGPQGTLYGRNSTGGTINVITNEPERRFSAGLNTQFGNYNLRHADAMVNVPLGDTVAARLAVMRETRDGYFSNDGYASDLTGARLKLLARPAEGLTLGLTYDHYLQKGTGATSVPRAADGLPPFANWAQYPADLSDPWAVDAQHPADQQVVKFDTISAQASVELGWATLSLLPSHMQSRRDLHTDLITGTVLAATLPQTIWVEKQDSVELRLTSPASSPVKWVAGAYAFRSENQQIANISSTLTYDTYGVTVPVRSRALFGQMTYPLNDSQRVIAGLRYTADDKSEHYGIRSNLSSYDSGLQSIAKTYKAATWKFGFEQDLAPGNMLYATASSGYKAGGFATSALPPRSYEPETLTAFELGSKNRFLDQTLQINAAAYYYKYKNAQLQYPLFEASPNPDDSSGTTQFAQYVTNAKTANNYGAEAELKWMPTANGLFKASVAYMKAKYGDMVVASQSSLSGSPMANTPTWSGMLGYEHNFDFSNGGMLTAGIQARITDGYWVTPEKTLANAWQSGYTKSDLTLSYRPSSERWSLGAWVRNLENKAVTSMAFPLGRVLISEPRTLGVNASVRF